MQIETYTTSADVTKRPPATPEQAITLLGTVLSYMLEAGAVVPHRTIEGELQLRIRFQDLDIKIIKDDKGVSSFALAARETVLVESLSADKPDTASKEEVQP